MAQKQITCRATFHMRFSGASGPGLLGLFESTRLAMPCVNFRPDLGRAAFLCMYAIHYWLTVSGLKRNILKQSMCFVSDGLISGGNTYS